MPGPEHFCFLLVEEFSHITFSCALEPLRLANLVSEEELYRWSFVSENGKTATCSNGAVTLTHHGLDEIPPCDYLMVLSGVHTPQHVTPALLDALRHERAKGTRIGALCSAAFILAKAGMLSGREVATHWEYHDLFLEQFPEVNLVRSIFAIDGPFVTASGGTAPTDLMLHLIEEKYGGDLALTVADQMVYNAVRLSTAEQTASLQSRHGMRNPSVAKAIQLMRDHIEDPLSPASLARDTGISLRQLERIFGRYLNCSPKKYYMDLRLQRARNLLVQTENSIRDIGLACGFDDASHFARVYRGKYGISPKQQRSKLS